MSNLVETVQRQLRLILTGILALGFLGSLEADETGPIAGEKVAFFGDSVTASGWNRPTGYIHLVSQALAMQGRKIVEVPAGINGNTTKELLARFDSDILSQKPNWLVLSCGMTDVWYGVSGVSLDQFKQNVTAIVNEATKAGIKVVLQTATMITENSNTPDNQKLNTYNDFLRSLAKNKGLPIADVFSDMQQKIVKMKQDMPNETGFLLTTDGVHMNGLGQETIAACILKAFGFTNDEINQSETGWIDLPSAMTLPAYTLTIRQYQQLQGLAAAHGCSVGKLTNDAFAKCLDDLVKNSSAPGANNPPNPKPAP